MSRPLSVTSSREVPVAAFVKRLRTEYNRRDFLPVELALISLSSEDSWTQRVRQIKTGMISTEDQRKLEEKVQWEVQCKEVNDRAWEEFFADGYDEWFLTKVPFRLFRYLLDKIS
jgi:3-phenylpropionate/cinnamic acid dioxygenase small subunit